MVVLSGKKEVSCDILYSEDCRNTCFENNLVIDNLFDICAECSRMAAIPQGAFAACKLRAQKETNLIVSKIRSSDKQESKRFDSKKLMEYTPVKYNSKLMKSIWGLYNRYSPHNMKGNDDDNCCEEMQMQQPIAVAAAVIAENLAMTFNSGNEWTFPAKRMC